MSTRRRSESERSPSDIELVLYGHNSGRSVVAVQQLNEATVRIYKRVNGKIVHEDAPFFPFFFLSSEAVIGGFTRHHWIKELTGGNEYRYLVAFSRWNDMWDAIRFVLTNHNKTALKRIGHYTELDAILLKPDPVTQFLLQSGITLFKGMSFHDLRRMQISMHAHAKANRPSDPRKTEDRILVIALTDNNGWHEALDARKLSEPDMLRAFVQIVTERDPDVLEGHALFDNTLPYLARRAELYSVDLALGRDGSSLHSYSPRGAMTERDFERGLFEAAGRHFIDTRILAHSYDTSKRILESYSLRSLAQHFGFASRERITLPQDRIAALWADQPDLLIQHARQEAKEILLLSNRLSPSLFYLCQMCPLAFGTMTRSGSASKIELLLLREYIRRKYSVPRARVGAQTTGAYTDVFLTGILPTVLYADIESLYPSIMLNRAIEPVTDELGVFQTLLRELTTRRLEEKRAVQSSSDPEDKANHDSLQSSLKILINSFYGYLGYPRGLFNDYNQADEVARAGQELLKDIIKQVELHNGQVIEVDTDGFFALAPDNVIGEEQEAIFVEKISSSLPEGIRLLHAGRYKKMLSYKKKNYALLDYEDRLTIRGSSLTSRSLERFARNFIQLSINCLLQEDLLGLHNLYVSFVKEIENHRWEAADFSRTDTIRDTFETYESEIKENKRKPAAAYEVARRSGLVLKPGDRVSYYVTGTQSGVKIAENSRLSLEWDPNFPDENTAYYLDRLNESAKKFEVFFEPHDFKKVFSTEDLFGFTADGIQLVSQRVAFPEEAPPIDEDGPEFGIWIDESGL